MKLRTKKIIKRTVLIVAGAGVITFMAIILRDKSLRKYQSKYYTLADMFRSDKATQLKIKNSTENEDYLLNIKALFKSVLDPACDLYGTRIEINSGFRVKELNDAIEGSSKTSQHMTGEAADLDTGSYEGNKKLFELIRKNLPYDQLINESNYSWVHVSHKRNGINRHQIL